MVQVVGREYNELGKPKLLQKQKARPGHCSPDQGLTEMGLVTVSHHSWITPNPRLPALRPAHWTQACSQAETTCSGQRYFCWRNDVLLKICSTPHTGPVCVMPLLVNTFSPTMLFFLSPPAWLAYPTPPSPCLCINLFTVHRLHSLPCLLQHFPQNASLYTYACTWMQHHTLSQHVHCKVHHVVHHVSHHIHTLPLYNNPLGCLLKLQILLLSCHLCVYSKLNWPPIMQDIFGVILYILNPPFALSITDLFLKLMPL